MPLVIPLAEAAPSFFHRKESGIDSDSVIQYLDQVIGYDGN